MSEQEEYLQRKEQIINNFITTTVLDFANKIYSSYPYSFEYADVSSFKEHFKSIYHIPRYPLSDTEWDRIIIKINEELQKIVDALVEEDELMKNEWMQIKAEKKKANIEFEEENNHLKR